VTGFALKYPGSWFDAMPGPGERLRGVLHRIAAIVLMGVSVYHLFDAVLTRPGRRLVLDLVPTRDDVRGAAQNLAYYLGISERKPEFARFNYAEKVEYWALVWGVLVMAATGTALWAKVPVGNHLPRWWLDIATAIHFYEAVLATLAILVWHFYQIFLDPDTYPMNWAWWDGKMPLHHYQEEHGLDREVFEQAQVDVQAESAMDAEPETTGVPHGK
jgi:cytochrome b subunit of formate dehydrogenase